MEADDAPEDEGPLLPWVSPDDRLWRHPSEMGSTPLRRAATAPERAPTQTRLWSVAMVAGVVGAIIASGVGVATGKLDRHTTVLRSVTNISPTSVAFTTSMGDHPPAVQAAPDWPSIANDISPSVVAVTTVGSDGDQSGSGVLYSRAAGRVYILTSSALVGDGKVEVTFDDSQSQSAHVVGVDDQSGVGLVSVRAPRSAQVVLPTWEPEGNLQDAEQVIGIGGDHALGGPGTVSGFDEAINSGDDATMENLIQVSSDAAAADGGEAMVDPSGAVLGIQAVVDAPGETAAGTIYVIPFDVAEHVAQQMIAGHRVTHPWLGTVNSLDPSTATARQLRLAGGAQVTEVAPGSPAARAGIRPSDIITSFDGRPVVSTATLTDLVDSCNPGRTATVAYLHDGRRATAKVTLTETPTDVALAEAG